MSDLSPCGALVQRGDPVRFRTALFASPEGREALFALYAFNLEVAKIAPMVSEPMIGEIRLQWWRDTLEMIYAEDRVRAHEVVEPLAALIRRNDLPRAPLDALIDARARDLDPAFPEDAAALDAYLRDTAGSLALLAVRALGGEADETAREAGFGIGAARYLAAVPVMAGQGGRPLPGIIDWKALRDGGEDMAFAETVKGLAARGRAAIAAARRARGSVPKAAAPALLEAPVADRYLAALQARPATLADLAAPDRSAFRANLSNLWRGVAGRW